MSDGLLIAKGTVEQRVLPRMANRHGLIAGATGTGKTVTIHAMAERFSEIGVPVFMADIKGDLAGLSQTGGGNARVDARLAELGLTIGHEPTAYPVVFWDVYGERGHPVRATVTEMGPTLLSRLLGLNETQAGVLQIAFSYADDEGLLLLDLKDLRQMLQEVAANAKALTTAYGNVSAASVGAIQRGLLRLEEAGGDRLFGEPALSLTDLIRTDRDGRGVVNLLAADKLIASPLVYATFLLWLLSELFETLPEIGDPDKPTIVFFFDEAHLLFTDMPDALRSTIEQVVRLIRSKGVGIYFISQNPLDIPETVLGQLGNRVQHALRAFTPRDQRAVKAAAETFRVNPELDVATAITELGVGEALTSFLDEDGTPGIVQRALVIPPRSRIGPITAAERSKIVNWSPIGSRYDALVDRESAFELLKAKAERAAEADSAVASAKAADKQAAADAKLQAAAEKRIVAAKRQRERASGTTPRHRRSASPENVIVDVVDDTARSMGRSFGRSLGQSLVRGLLGGLRGRR